MKTLRNLSFYLLFLIISNLLRISVYSFSIEPIYAKISRFHVKIHVVCSHQLFSDHFNTVLADVYREKPVPYEFGYNNVYVVFFLLFCDKGCVRMSASAIWLPQYLYSTGDYVKWMPTCTLCIILTSYCSFSSSSIARRVETLLSGWFSKKHDFHICESCDELTTHALLRVYCNLPCHPLVRQENEKKRSALAYYEASWTL